MENSFHEDKKDVSFNWWEFQIHINYNIIASIMLKLNIHSSNLQVKFPLLFFIGEQWVIEFFWKGIVQRSVIMTVIKCSYKAGEDLYSIHTLVIWCFGYIGMVAALPTPPPNFFCGDLKISDQNNYRVSHSVSVCGGAAPQSCNFFWKPPPSKLMSPPWDALPT